MQSKQHLENRNYKCEHSNIKLLFIKALYKKNCVNPVNSNNKKY